MDAPKSDWVIIAESGFLVETCSTPILKKRKKEKKLDRTNLVPFYNSNRLFL